MSNTKYFKVPGIASWNHVYKPDDFMNQVNYTFALVVNESSQAIIEKYGLQGQFKDHDSGDKVYNFKRPAEKMILKKWVSFAPPVLYGPDGKVLCEYKYKGEVTQSVNELIDYTEFEPTGEQPIIGHGSSVILDICVYSTMKGNGARLQSIKLVDLIEYVPEARDDEQQTPAVAEPKVNAEGVKAPW